MIPPPVPEFPDQEPAATSVVPEPSVQYSPRILLLDVLRGLAVLGGLFVSIWIFGGFTENKQDGLLVQSKGFDYRLFGTVDLLLDGKMRALIALVFGAGMLLFLSKDNQKGELPVHDRFVRRQMWLMLFGIINAALLLWTHDVVFHLGIMGILLLPFIRLSARGLVLAAAVCTLFYSGKQYWEFADHKKAHSKYLAVINLEKKIEKDSIDRAKKNTGKAPVKKDTLTSQQKNDKQAWMGIVAGKKPDPKKDDDNTKNMRSLSYAKVWKYALPTLQSREAQWTYKFGIWDFSSTILLGMALLKLGFFMSSFSRRKYLLLGLAGLTAGLLLGWYRLHFNQIALFDYEKFVSGKAIPYDLLFPFERIFTALGYAGLVAFMVASGWFAFIWKALAAAGRLALTNYLVQTLICTFFFYGYGMGYYGRLTQVQLYYFVAEVLIAQVVFSVLWLRHYQYGPVEWLWRCLSSGKRISNRLRQPVTIEPALS